MKKRFTEEQIVTILNAIERSGKTKARACREHGINENTYYRWRKKYHGMETSDISRLRELERDNARLKRLLAERCMEVDALAELVKKKL